MVEAKQATPKQQAKRIFDTSGVKGGLVVHIGCGDGRLTAALRPNDSYLVHGLDKSAKNVAKARKYIQSVGLYGNVSVDQWKGKRLPYIDNLINLVVLQSRRAGEVPRRELLRVLAPNGVACIKRGDNWTKITKPRPKEMDEWTHYLHGPDGNPVASDSMVGPLRGSSGSAVPAGLVTTTTWPA